MEFNMKNRMKKLNPWKWGLSRKKEFLEKWNHRAHYVTVSLVAVALLTAPFSAAGSAATLAEALHAVHLFTIALTALYLLLFVLLSRNVGRELAAALTAATAEPASERERTYKFAPVKPEDVEFVSEADAKLDALIAMNLEGFAGSAFEMTEDELRERNTAFVIRNPKAFLLVRNPLRMSNEDDEFIGFSCMLPLNAIGADCYLNGVVKDRDIRASLLCAPGEQCDSILLFAIMLKKKYRKIKGLPSRYYPFLLRCANHHIRTLARAHDISATAQTMWVQSEHPDIRKHLRRQGFARAERKKSADGFNLYFRLLNGTPLTA
jgi:hypothetical protein